MEQPVLLVPTASLNIVILIPRSAQTFHRLILVKITHVAQVKNVIKPVTLVTLVPVRLRLLLFSIIKVVKNVCVKKASQNSMKTVTGASV